MNIAQKKLGMVTMLVVLDNIMKILHGGLDGSCTQQGPDEDTGANQRDMRNQQTTYVGFV